jgi:hypothetical protein
MFKIVAMETKFVFIMLTMSCLYFTLTGFQFWIPDYMKNVIGIDEKTVFFSYTICCITGPSAGIVTGGVITHYLGGYNEPICMKLIFLVGFFCVGVALPIPLVSQYWFLIILIWFFLFFGGFAMPTLVGMSLFLYFRYAD